jgi:DNA-binding NarL/FixJ family response regulator
MRASLKSLLVDVCKTRCVPLEDVVGRAGERLIVEARREFVKRARRELKISYPVIGRAINRDHTTVLHLYRTEPVPLKSQTGALSPRERDILALMRMGYGRARIAVHLNLQESTVGRYMRSIKAKSQ